MIRPGPLTPTNRPSLKTTPLSYSARILIVLNRRTMTMKKNGIVFNGKIDVVILPLLAYDLEGNRIGYGKGFYDNFISNLELEPLKIGISYFSPEKSLESNNHDINLDYCITPNQIFSFSEKSYY